MLSHYLLNIHTRNTYMDKAILLKSLDEVDDYEKLLKSYIPVTMIHMAPFVLFIKSLETCIHECQEEISVRLMKYLIEILLENPVKHSYDNIFDSLNKAIDRHINYLRDCLKSGGVFLINDDGAILSITGNITVTKL